MAWIKAKHEGDLAGVAARLYHSNIILSDLDDTLAKSPMKKVAYGFLKRPDMLANPKFIAWCAKAAWKKAVKGKKAESELGREFVEKFLDGRERKKLEEKMSFDYMDELRESAFPGVFSFYSMLPNAMKIIVTRSIHEIAWAYRCALDFDFSMEEQYDKKKSVDFIMRVFPKLKRYAIFGDSAEDEEMVDYLRFQLVKGSIDTLVSVHIAKSEKKANPDFDCSIGRNYSSLAELISKYFRLSSSSQ
ncbi:MAG: hypothetical protein PHO02_04355 [Candidatus Nanoarchaeia archaeon]|nr:hypothetical protein [Candidatus Nanoarchaeia archaeon]